MKPASRANLHQASEPIRYAEIVAFMYDPTTPFQVELAKRLLRRAAKLNEQADRLAEVSSVFRRSPIQDTPQK